MSMMPVPVKAGGVLGIQRKVRILGHIRMGERDPQRNFPTKLQNFRITSSDPDKLNAISHQYGGEVTRWEDGDGYQLKLDAKKLHVLIPPWSSYHVSWNMWLGPGNRDRLCNGEVMSIKDGKRQRGDIEGNLPACICPEDIGDRADAAKPKGKPARPSACSPHIRAEFIIDNVGMQMDGVWVLDSKGMNAAAELPVTMDKLMAISTLFSKNNDPRKAGGFLWIENRSSKKQGEATRKFIVPVLEPDVSDEAAQALPGYHAAITAAVEGRVLPALPAKFADEPALDGETKMFATYGQEDEPEEDVVEVPEGDVTELPAETPRPVATSFGASDEEEKVAVPDNSGARVHFIMTMNEAGIDDDEQKEFLESTAGVTSRKDATKEQFTVAIDRALEEYRANALHSAKKFFGPDGRQEAADWMTAKTGGVPVKQFGLVQWVKVARLLETENSKAIASRVEGGENVEELPW